MNTDYMDALDEVNEIAPGISCHGEQEKDYYSIDDENEKEIWEYVAKWYEPTKPREAVLCRLGFHQFRGYNKKRMLDTICSQFFGVCVRCGVAKKTGWRG